MIAIIHTTIGYNVVTERFIRLEECKELGEVIITRERPNSTLPKNHWICSKVQRRTK